MSTTEAQQLRDRIAALDKTIAGQPDFTTFNARVTALRVAHPTMSLTEARTIAHGQAEDEGYAAPAVGDGPFTGQPINVPEDEAPSLAELVMDDLARDPRAQDALRWSDLSPEEQEAEKQGNLLLQRITRLQADEADKGKAEGFTPQSVEQYLTRSDAPDDVRKAARAIFDKQQAEAATAKAADEARWSESEA